MRILFVNAYLPMYDRASADLRMFTLVRLLAAHGHTCIFCAYNYASQQRSLGDAKVAMYRASLEQEGVTVCLCAVEKVLKQKRFEVVYFKYFFTAERHIASVRIWQPGCRVIVDSVDLAYARLLAKADMSGLHDERTKAEEIKRREIATYASADLVITITDQDDEILKRDFPSANTYVIPNIHTIHRLKRKECEHPSLLFIGTFEHEPNVDAVLYFKREIWPLIEAKIEDVIWTVVGPDPSDEILEIASDRILIKGFVPDTLPYLLRTWVSIAPLRYGAGMKGKVGEAMAAGVPVVTTGFGIQGMNVVSGKHLLVADDPESFAAQLVRLLKNKELRDMIGMAAQDFIASRYSLEAVDQILQELFGDVSKMPAPKRLPFRMTRKAFLQAHTFLQRHLLWRFRV
ncbi:MAG: glycosyltransferase [Deltaproteobacteria bacterium]|nr:glycosyltransferase [Deltaproteobacteria bacterium]